MHPNTAVHCCGKVLVLSIFRACGTLVTLKARSLKWRSVVTEFPERETRSANSHAMYDCLRQDPKLVQVCVFSLNKLLSVPV